jgi:hypothetical protein
VKRPRTLIASSLGLIVLVAMIAVGIALAGSDDDDTTATPPPGDAVETPTATPTPGAPAGLPPEFFDCLADQGVVIESPDEIHSVSPEVLQACFGSLHGGGGAP